MAIAGANSLDWPLLQSTDKLVLLLIISTFQRYLNSYFVKTTNQTKKITQRDQIHAVGYFNMLVSGALALAFLAENVCADVGSVTNERRERSRNWKENYTVRWQLSVVCLLHVTHSHLIYREVTHTAKAHLHAHLHCPTSKFVSAKRHYAHFT